MMISVHQPHYLPWLGYFDKIDRSDVFVILDNVQYKKREYQNRNRIRTPWGVKWLTVPVVTQGRYEQKTGEVEIDGTEDWRGTHLKTIEHSYHGAPHFERLFPEIKKLYFERDWKKLAELNVRMLEYFMGMLGIGTPVRLESELGVSGTSTERIVNICVALGADTYLSGAGGKEYMEESLFAGAGLNLAYQKYEHPAYPQAHGGFEPYMGIIDLMFNTGEGSMEIIRGGRREA